MKLSLPLACVALAATMLRSAPLPGQLMLHPDNPHALQRQGGGSVLICGPGDPENFLYRGERQPDGTRRGDQIELIEKLARHGGNSVYLQAVRTHGGDAKTDKTQNPFVDSDPAKSLDSRILDQWEQWFALMDRHDILIYFLFYDDSARIWNTGNDVGEPERRFFEAIVRRFKHHRNLIWIVGEEVDERYSPPRVRALAEIIQRADDHGHIIGSHHLSGTTFRAWEEGSALRQFSMQLNLKPDAVHAGAVEAWTKAAGRYQVLFAENTATPADPDSQRRHAWTVAMAGLMPMMLQMDIAGTPPQLLAQCRVLQRFFESTDFPLLAPHDELRAAATRYVLADPGRSYIAYTSAAGAVGLQGLPAGRCRVTWVECRTGRTLEQEQTLSGEGVREFVRPANFGDETAAWVWFPDVTRVPRASPPAAAGSAIARGANRPPHITDREITTRAGAAAYVQLQFTDEDGPGPYRYTIIEQPRHGTLTGTDNDRTYRPTAGFSGTDRFSWKVSDGQAESTVGRVSIRVEGTPP